MLILVGRFVAFANWFQFCDIVKMASKPLIDPGYVFKVYCSRPLLLFGRIKVSFIFFSVRQILNSL